MHLAPVTHGTLQSKHCASALANSCRHPHHPAVPPVEGGRRAPERTQMPLQKVRELWMQCWGTAPAAQKLSRGSPNVPPKPPTSPSWHRRRQTAAAAFAVISVRVKATAPNKGCKGFLLWYLANRPQALIEQRRHRGRHGPAGRVGILSSRQGVSRTGSPQTSRSGLC